MLKFRPHRLKCKALDYQGCENSAWESRKLLLSAKLLRTVIYLNIIRFNRNTSDGNGAHASYLLTEAQLDAHIKAFLTLYLYVTGMCYDRLKAKYDI